MVGQEQGHLCADVGGGKEGGSHMEITEKRVPARGGVGGLVSCQCKGPEVGACLTFEEQ